MTLGVSSYTWTWAVRGDEGQPGLSAFDLLDRAKTLGVGVLQLGDNVPLQHWSDREVSSLADSAVTAGVRLEVGTRGIGHDLLERYLELAVALGSGIVRVVVDDQHWEPTPSEAARHLAAMRSAFLEAGVVLAIENHDRFRARALAGLVEELGTEWAGICLDTVNSFGALEGPEVVVTTLAPYVVNLHVKDFVVERAWHSMGFSIHGRPTGQGVLDVPWLLGTLAGRARAHHAIIELWTPPEDTVDQTIAKEARWAMESVAFLSPLLVTPGTGVR